MRASMRGATTKRISKEILARRSNEAGSPSDASIARAQFADRAIGDDGLALLFKAAIYRDG